MDAAAAHPGLPFILLSERFGLSEFEREVLLLAASAEVDTGLPLLMADAQGDPARRFPTFALAMSLFAEPSWDCLSPLRPLRARQLIEVHQSGAASLLTAPIRIDERIAAHIKGIDYLDERLSSIVTALPSIGALPPSQEQIAQNLATHVSAPGGTGVVQLVGTHAAAKADLVARAAALAGSRAFAVAIDTLPTNHEELATFVRVWSREAQLQSIVLFIQGVEAVEPLGGEDGKGPTRQRWPRLLGEIDGSCLLDVRQVVPNLAAPFIVIAPPTHLERQERWRRTLTIDGAAPHERAVRELAGEFTTSASQLDHTAARALELEATAARPGAERVARATMRARQECVRRAGAALAGVTRWIEPRVSLDDVQLPASERLQLERLVLHARQRWTVANDFGFAGRSERGLGLSALFYGESGTGKTFAAEAVASALGLGLACTELATLQSKYIGETEKNLRRIFDAAEEGGAVLFFDEADALFGKRTDAKDSHDRYANIEVNYLLSRMEQFTGVAILATNLKQALDPAFMRRMRFVVGFPFPGVAERTAIWQRVFPAETPLANLEYDRLARFALSGGSIFNAALSAAHDAAADGPGHPVTMRHLLDAVKHELRKVERPIAESEFRETPTPLLRREVTA
jgi:hypothetical protein